MVVTVVVVVAVLAVVASRSTMLFEETGPWLEPGTAHTTSNPASANLFWVAYSRHNRYKTRFASPSKAVPTQASWKNSSSQNSPFLGENALSSVPGR